MTITIPTQRGVGPFPMNNPNGVRMSTALTYVNPNRHRLNLTIRANVRVRRILFDTGSTGSRARRGWKWRAGARPSRSKRTKSFLCAGAIASPQLLMLSGVGAGRGVG